jgi:hypothetical protein
MKIPLVDANPQFDFHTTKAQLPKELGYKLEFEDERNTVTSVYPDDVPAIYAVSIEYLRALMPLVVTFRSKQSLTPHRSGRLRRENGRRSRGETARGLFALPLSI